MVNLGITCSLISIALILTYISRAAGATSEGVVISPKHVHFMGDGEHSAQHEVTCKATSPEVACEFRLFDLTKDHLNPTVIYHVEGLTSNNCVMTLNASKLVTEHYYIATCRVRSAYNDWAYASTSVYKSNKYPMPVQETYDQVVLPGSKLNIAVLGLARLSRCGIRAPNSKKWTVPFFRAGDSWSSCKQKDYYYGRNQAACLNTCGKSYDKVTEAHNGIFFFDLESSRGSEKVFVNVIVAKLPSELTLNHEMLDNADGSVMLKATCTVRGSRPTPLVTWLLDGDVVPEEAVRSVAVVKWAWPYDEQTVQQIMTLKINKSHAGKEVSCTVKHPKIKFTLNNTFKIRSG